MLSASYAQPISPDPGDGGGVGGNAASAPGSSYSWVGSVDNTNTAIPTVNWGARGGMTVDLTLYHNSESTFGGGIHERLTVNGNSVTSYDLIEKDQTKWHFDKVGAGGFYLTAVSDENGNTITINRASSVGMIGVIDPSGRQATFGFNCTYYTSITDPLNRVVNFSFDANGSLSSDVSDAQ